MVGACSEENPSVELGALGAPFNCDDPIDSVVGSPPAGYQTSVGVVALPDGDEQLQRGRTGMDNDADSRRRFSKMGLGLLVRPGSSFELHVGPRSQGNALIHWGNAGTDDPVGSLSIDCDGDPERWLVYPGGVWTLEPECVQLLIRIADDTDEINLPIDTTCP